LTDVDQGSCTLARVAEYRSCIPRPPGLIHEAPAIVGRQTPSALAHADKVDELYAARVRS
jgi:hypothetical protein